MNISLLKPISQFRPKTFPASNFDIFDVRRRISTSRTSRPNTNHVFNLLCGCYLVPVRLRGGSGPHEGRLEVYVNNKWGTVAAGFVRSNEAEVVCRQLGYTGRALATNSAVFGRGSGYIGYTSISCYYKYDMPKHIGECVVSRTEHGDHDFDVGVICNGKLINN